MRDVEAVLDDVFLMQERLSRDEINRRAIAAAAPAEVLTALDRTRHDTLRHGSDQALENHTERTAELEAEYLRRFPEREVDPERLREGARHRWQLRTGAEQPWDPEDFAVAVGRDPTPANVEWARTFLAEHGASAVERVVP